MRFKRFHGTLVFLISLIVSFAVFGGIMLAFITYTKGHMAEIKQEDIPYISDYRPSVSENLNLLLLGCEKQESEPSISMLICYNAPQGVLNVVLMPSTTVATRKDGRTDSIIGHYDYEGLAGSTLGVSSLFDIEVEKYIRIQKIGVANMTDFFGGLPFNVKSPLVTAEETIVSGEQLLDGRRLSAIAFNEVRPHTQNVSLQKELFEKLLKKGLSNELVSKYDSLVSAIFYNCETNLNQNDFVKRQTGFLNMLKLDSLVIKFHELKGSYKSSYTLFEPNLESLAQIKSAIKPEMP